MSPAPLHQQVLALILAVTASAAPIPAGELAPPASAPGVSGQAGGPAGGKELAEEDRELLKEGEFRCIRIVPPPAEKNIKPGFEGRGVLIEDSLPFINTDNFRAQLAGFLGRPLTLRTIRAIAEKTTEYYKQNDRPVVDVVVPGQNISTGTLQLVVVEARLGRVRAEGLRWSRPEQLTRQVRLEPGRPISERALLADLEYLNQGGFRHVKPVFEKGAQLGTTDLVLETKDRLPFRFYTGYEDTGNRVTGQDRYLAGFNYGNAWMMDHELGYQFTSDVRTDRYLNHSGYYRAPLPFRHSLSVFGNYLKTNADVPGTDFRIGGESWQISARYSAPLPRFGDYRHQVQGGPDLKSYDNDLAFGGTHVFVSAVRLAQCAMEYSGSRPDKWGNVNFSLTGYYSPGHVTENQRLKDYEAARAGSNPNYAYGVLTVERRWALPHELSLVNRFTGQLATRRLAASEQLGLGGYNTVRGYDERELNGDQGILATFELRSPDFLLGRIGSGNRFESRLQVLLFCDYGHADVKWPRADERPEQDLVSIGAGVRYRMGTHVTIRFEYGRQLKEGAPTADDQGRIHLGVTVSY